jgi:ParB family protein of integrating conjugative element (PFGI_1 class)
MSRSGCAKRVVSVADDHQDADTRPPAGQVIPVEVTRIHAYERNPRHGRNPEYDRIRASILAHGMDQVLQITQRPTDGHFIVRAGGNTRLQIVKELLAATGEERFRVVDCLFVPWDSETAVLLAHLRENDLRGNLTFIDKAGAVLEAKVLIAEELGVDDISHRELEVILRERGYSVTHVLVSLMNYATTMLLEAIPSALAAGLGRRHVQRIRKLERASRAIWHGYGIGDDAEFDDTFRALCQRYDSEDWVIEPLRQAIDLEISAAADADVQSVRMAIDCRLSGQAVEIPAVAEPEPGPGQDYEHSDPEPTRSERPAPVERTPCEGSPTDNAADAAPVTPEQMQTATARKQDDADVGCSIDLTLDLPSASDTDELLRHLLDSGTAPSVSLGERRELAYTLAERLAGRYGLGGLIVRITDDGLGYVVRDWPPVSMLASLDRGMRDLVSAIWWQLMSFADMTAVPVERLVESTDIDGRLATALKRGGELAADAVSVVHPAEFGCRVWRQLNEQDWRDWLCLAQNYRALHRTAEALDTPLWRADR